MSTTAAVETDSKQTCATYMVLYGYTMYDATGGKLKGPKAQQEIDRIIGLDIETVGLDGERSTLVKGSRIRIGSLAFGDCYKRGDVWVKTLGCNQRNGKSVLSWEMYYDDQCTNIVVPGDYFYHGRSTKLNASLETTYSRNVGEGEVSQTWRRMDTKVRYYEQIYYDIVCYEEAMKETTESSPVIQYKDMHEPRAQNYGDLSEMDLFDREFSNFHKIPIYNEPQHPLYDAPQQVIYDGPQAPDYDSNWWTYLAVNVLVSIICTLCVIAVCLAAYYYMQNKSDYSPVEWAKEEETDV